VINKFLTLEFRHLAWKTVEWLLVRWNLKRDFFGILKMRQIWCLFFHIMFLKQTSFLLDTKMEFLKWKLFCENMWKSRINNPYLPNQLAKMLDDILKVHVFQTWCSKNQKLKQLCVHILKAEAAAHFYSYFPKCFFSTTERRRTKKLNFHSTALYYTVISRF
jgi:hypothetical protein